MNNETIINMIVILITTTVIITIMMDYLFDHSITNFNEMTSF